MLFVWFYFGKMWKFSEKTPFFRADMAGLGKYHMGGYGRIGVYRVKVRSTPISKNYHLRHRSVCFLLQDRSNNKFRNCRVCFGWLPGSKLRWRAFAWSVPEPIWFVLVLSPSILSHVEQGNLSMYTNIVRVIVFYRLYSSFCHF